jgi:hypothetical protein
MLGGGGFAKCIGVYADDIVLLAPSWRGIHCLLDLLTSYQPCL